MRASRAWTQWLGVKRLVSLRHAAATSSPSATAEITQERRSSNRPDGRRGDRGARRYSTPMSMSTIPVSLLLATAYKRES